MPISISSHIIMIVERPISVIQFPSFSPTPSITFNPNSTSDSGLDTTPLSPTAMLAVKIYAFGGLAFMIGVILFAFGVWFWTVIIKREWANSPPDLELHPEVCPLFSYFTNLILNDL